MSKGININQHTSEIELNKIFGELLIFISNVASTIRMQSSEYNSSSEVPNEAAKNVIGLTSYIDKFNERGEPLINNNLVTEIIMKYKDEYKQTSEVSKKNAVNLMWLADSMHNFTELGQAFIDNDLKQIKFEAERVIRKWEAEETKIDEASCSNMPGSAIFTIKEGINIIKKLTF